MKKMRRLFNIFGLPFLAATHFLIMFNVVNRDPLEKIASILEHSFLCVLGLGIGFWVVKMKEYYKEKEE